MSEQSDSAIQRFRASDGVHEVVEDRDDEYITQLENDEDGQLFAWPKDLEKREDIEVLE